MSYSYEESQVDKVREFLSGLLDVYKRQVMGSEDHVFMKVIDKIQPTLKKYFNIEIINECGHVCCLQKWRDYNDMVRNFYNTLLPPHVDQADAAGA